ncbi:hypothetical protein BD309DRAFT_869304 [Dichomitus squalens]|uniref:Uncharacterized protein n=2 Tax=Dichomitus squalens TaxID=114155 RepID=A0A4Q9NMI4_9APHY|nr:uncharacterized protein DICSQDRAFT_157159 [Dichomitus squalens LYAD-421 SS1]EJF57729.1 hypothetical protein DICSQDRAFT_157159 [Dichomitus squalens LYAD-421 SS1]TBU40921.1 hypothetical protein BD309DRAFT_869304 [Dichomitus squalens]TBU64274.1 hypothetical protein BD310DRAFT_806275 [Dichomitus squalens]
MTYCPQYVQSHLHRLSTTYIQLSSTSLVKHRKATVPVVGLLAPSELSGLKFSTRCLVRMGRRSVRSGLNSANQSGEDCVASPRDMTKFLYTL